MRTLFPVIIAILLILLTGCCASTNRCTTSLASNYFNRQNVIAITKNFYPPKNPRHITLYSDEHKPLTPYRIIGIATVSKYNLIGKLRQEETLNAMMKNLAASIGGDAIIRIANDSENVKAHVIQFQRILL